MYRLETIAACMATIQMKAILHQGLDYLQVFVDPTKPEKLWIIEDGPAAQLRHYCQVSTSWVFIQFTICWPRNDEHRSLSMQSVGHSTP